MKRKLKHYQSIMNCSTIMWMDNWPEEGYRQVGTRCLALDEGDDEEALDSLLESEKITQPDEVVKQALRMHADMGRAIKKYAEETGHLLFLTPCTFVNLLQTFKEIFRKRAQHYSAMQKKFETGLSKLDETERKVCDVQDDVEQKTPLLLQTQLEIEAILQKLDEAAI